MRGSVQQKVSTPCLLRVGVDKGSIKVVAFELVLSNK